MRQSIPVAALIVVGLLGATLGGCGGGGGGSVSGPSSSSTGGGSGGSSAVVQGQIVRGGQAAQGEPVIVVALRRVFGIRLAEAATGTPVSGAIVTLTAVSGGGPVAPATTDVNGNFTFTNVLPGTYMISVTLMGVPKTITLPSPAQLTVGADDLGTIHGTVTNDTVVIGTVDVAVTIPSAEGIFQNDAQLGHAMNIAQAAHVSLEQVIDLRLQGLGWGEIAHHFGVSPGVIGLGRSNLSDTDLANARASHAGGQGKGKGKS